MQNKQLTGGKRKNACGVTQAFMLKMIKNDQHCFQKKEKIKYNRN